MTGVQVKFRNVVVELKKFEKVGISFASTIPLLLKSRNQLCGRLSSLMRLIETRSPLTSDINGPGLVRFQFKAAFPLRKKTWCTGVDGEPVMGWGLWVFVFKGVWDARNKLAVIRAIIKMT
jgi:hypothetical protein